MAAITPSETKRISMGNVTLFVYSFSSVNGGSSTGDTYNTGLGTNILHAWAQCETLQSTQTSTGVNIDYDTTPGTIMIQPAVNASKVDVFVMANA